MRHYAWLALLCAAGCGPSTNETPTDVADMAVASGPDLAPTCLAVEPDPPQVDPNCPVVKPDKPDALDEAFTKMGVDRCSLTLSTNGYAGARDPYRLPWYDAAHDHAVNGPAFASTLTSRLDAAAKTATPVANQLVLLGNRLGTSIAACVPAPAVDAAQPLARAVAQLIRDAGGTPDDAALEEDAKDVPLDLQAAVAAVVLGVDTANADWSALVADLSADDLATLAQTSGFVASFAGSGPPAVTDAAVKTLLSKTWNETALVAGAARFAAAIENAHLARFAGTKGFTFDQKTPIGRVVVRDANDDTYEDDDSDAICMLLDTGGNDTYRKPVGAVGGTQAVGANFIHVAVAIDLAGKDNYGYVEKPVPGDTAKDKAMGPIQRLPSDGDGRYTRRSPQDYGPISMSDQVRQGGARLGYGFLFDLGSEADHYRSLRMSQGFGCAGVGVLYDAGGDDLYEGEAAVQGSGVFGVGLLLDAGGDDTYKTYSCSQGFGYSRGVGALYDAAGADKYLSDIGIPSLGGDPIYISPQTPCDTKGAACGNSSFTQGVGFGRRAPGNGDNANMSGGLGVLRDLTGDDVYTTSVFGQGSGYWFGTGILSDGAGNDTYDGWWYTQGSDAHAALCIFEDDGGDDKYDVTYPNNPPYATNTGQGHDYSIGWHIDRGGNDRYRGTGLGLGGGNANGGGFFVNIGGDDVYDTPAGTVLGGAAFDMSAGRSPTVPCYGMFIDIGGTDTYKVPADPRLQPPPADNTTWTNPRDDQPFNDRTVGVDRASGTISLP